MVADRCFDVQACTAAVTCAVEVVAYGAGSGGSSQPQSTLSALSSTLGASFRSAARLSSKEKVEAALLALWQATHQAGLLGDIRFRACASHIGSAFDAMRVSDARREKAAAYVVRAAERAVAETDGGAPRKGSSCAAHMRGCGDRMKRKGASMEIDQRLDVARTPTGRCASLRDALARTDEGALAEAVARSVLPSRLETGARSVCEVRIERRAKEQALKVIAAFRECEGEERRGGGGMLAPRRTFSVSSLSGKVRWRIGFEIVAPSSMALSPSEGAGLGATAWEELAMFDVLEGSRLDPEVRLQFLASIVRAAMVTGAGRDALPADRAIGVFDAVGGGCETAGGAPAPQSRRLEEVRRRGGEADARTGGSATCDEGLSADKARCRGIECEHLALQERRANALNRKEKARVRERIASRRCLSCDDDCGSSPECGLC